MGVKETGMDFWRAQWADQIGRSFFHARFMFSLLCTCKSGSRYGKHCATGRADALPLSRRRPLPRHPVVQAGSWLFAGLCAEILACCVLPAWAAKEAGQKAGHNLPWSEAPLQAALCATPHYTVGFYPSAYERALQSWSTGREFPIADRLLKLARPALAVSFKELSSPPCILYSCPSAHSAALDRGRLWPAFWPASLAAHAGSTQHARISAHSLAIGYNSTTAAAIYIEGS